MNRPPAVAILLNTSSLAWCTPSSAPLPPRQAPTQTFAHDRCVVSVPSVAASDRIASLWKRLW